MASVLYISYDGLMEPIGQSQIFEYLRLLAKNHKITLLSFEKKGDWSDETRRKRFESAARHSGIEWIPLHYHKAPAALAKLFDVFIGILFSLWLALSRHITIVHSRSGGPALAIAWPLHKVLGLRLIYDLRGFWAEQRAESGFWRKDSLQYKVAIQLQKRALIDSATVVSLTHAGVEAAKAFPFLQGLKKDFRVIPTCTNMRLFSLPSASIGQPKKEHFTLGIVGSVGIWYLLDEMLDCFKRIRAVSPGARLLILNRDNHALIRRSLEMLQISDRCVELSSAGHDDVPTAMRTMDAGVFLLKRVPSMAGVAPTKMGEFLACGVPCLSNAGIGDVERILVGENVGTVVQDFSSREKDSAVEHLMRLAAEPDIRERCASAAKRYFSLEHGVEAYDRIYHDLA